MSAYLPELLFWLPRWLATHMRQRHTAEFVRTFAQRVMFHVRRLERAECAEEAELARHFRDRIGGVWNAETEPVSSNDALDWFRIIVRCNEDMMFDIQMIIRNCDPVMFRSGSRWQAVCVHADNLPFNVSGSKEYINLYGRTGRRILGDEPFSQCIRAWKLERMDARDRKKQRRRRVGNE